MTVGATDMYVYKYLGPSDQGPSDDFTQPHYDKLDPTNIQDLLFLENRDRVYSNNIYRLRGHYNVQNIDFDLSQFGLFLNNDTIFITFHYNDMLDILGRKLMVGDVLELPHLTDYHPLNEKIPVGLRRYYQITDGNFASEGFSQTWYYHLWRVKAEPLIDSEEFANILSRPIEKDNWLGDWVDDKVYPPGYTVSYGNKNWTNPGPGDIPVNIVPSLDPGNPWRLDTKDNLIDILSTYNTNLEINDHVIAEAKRIVPKTGYDRTQLYLVPTFTDNQPAPPINIIIDDGIPITTTGLITTVATQYGAAPVIRISADNLATVRRQLEGKNVEIDLQQFVTTSLHAAVTTPVQTDSGSGAVEGNVILTATPLNTITGPYGTADNTYATADQYVSWLISANASNIYSTIISTLTPVTQDMVPGLLLSATAPIPAGGTVDIFAPDTRVSRVIDQFTFTITKPMVQYMPQATSITVSSDFKGTVSSTMDYRADCDPRFQFIRRASPRYFGYIQGYMTGQDEFPNGEPFDSGISFPSNPQIGDYFLRTDYLPQQLFRFDGAVWIKISENVRTEFGFDAGSENQLSTFINNRNRTPVQSGGTVPQRQSLSDALRIRPD